MLKQSAAMTDAEMTHYAARWMVKRKKAQGNAEMTEEDVEAWGEMIRGLPGWEPGPPVIDGVSIQELWRSL
jgi:hypothetical protein